MVGAMTGFSNNHQSYSGYRLLNNYSTLLYRVIFFDRKHKEMMIVVIYPRSCDDEIISVTHLSVVVTLRLISVKSACEM